MNQKGLLYPVVLITLWTAIFIATITRPAMYDDADSFHAEVVREMVQSGDWVTLRINNGIRYLEKAPFMYWLAAVSVSTFGLQDWAVRLPNALFSLLLILLVFRFGTQFWGEMSGFYSGLVIATCLGHYAFSRIFLPDIILSFFIVCSFYMYMRITVEEEEPKGIGPVDLRCAALYFSAAMAVLTKGLIGLIFTGAIIFVHILVTGNWKVIRRLQIGYGIVIFLLVTAPWHIAAALANPDFLWFYFVREHLLRYLGMRYPTDHGHVPLPVLWGLLLVWLFPWSAFIWGLVPNFPRSIRQQDATARVCLLLFLWIGVILAFFAFGYALEYYVCPTLPAFALLLGKAMSDLDALERSFSKWGVVSIGVMAAIAISVGSGMFALAWTGSHLEPASSLSETLTVNPEYYDICSGHIYDLTPATFSHLAPLVYQTSILLIVGPLAAFLFAVRKRWMVCFLFLAAMMVGLCYSFNAGMIAFEPVLSSKSLAKVIQYHHRLGDKIVINDFYEKGSTLNYYSGLQVHVLNCGVGVLWYGLQDKTAPKLCLTQDELLKEWTSEERIFLFSETKPLESLLSLHPDFKYRVLAEDGGKKILINW